MINKNIFKSERHTSSYLSCGPFVGGFVMFFDDFLQHDDNRILQSYVGVDKFLSLYSDYLKIEYFQNNLVVRKKTN